MYYTLSEITIAGPFAQDFLHRKRKRAEHRKGKRLFACILAPSKCKLWFKDGSDDDDDDDGR